MGKGALTIALMAVVAATGVVMHGRARIPTATTSESTPQIQDAAPPENRPPPIAMEIQLPPKPLVVQEEDRNPPKPLIENRPEAKKAKPDPARPVPKQEPKQPVARPAEKARPAEEKVKPQPPPPPNPKTTSIQSPFVYLRKTQVNQVQNTEIHNGVVVHQDVALKTKVVISIPGPFRSEQTCEIGQSFYGTDHQLVRLEGFRYDWLLFSIDGVAGTWGIKQGASVATPQR